MLTALLAHVAGAVRSVALRDAEGLWHGFSGARRAARAMIRGVAVAFVMSVVGLYSVDLPVALGQNTGHTIDAETVTVAYEVALRERTPEEARELALSRARAEAVRRVAGVQVHAERTSLSNETSQGIDRQFTQSIRTSTSGRVVQESVLEAGIRERGGEMVYCVQLQATVQVQMGRTDPAFAATLRLNDPDRLYVAGSSHADSDEIVVTVEVTQNAYLTLFSVTDDTVQVVWPNALLDENRAPAQVPIEFPPPDWRKRGLRLRAELPEGLHQRPERFVLVATKENIPFDSVPNLAVEGGVLATRQASLHALNMWLVQIPLDQRAIATATYHVKRDAP